MMPMVAIGNGWSRYLEPSFKLQSANKLLFN